MQNNDEKEVRFTEVKLTAKAHTVLNIMLSHADQGLTALQLTEIDPDLNIHTVQNVLRNLMNDGLIKIKDVVYSGTVLCRSYQITEKAKDVSVERFVDQFENLRKSVPVPAIFSALVGKRCDPEVIREIRKFVEEQEYSSLEE